MAYNARGRLKIHPPIRTHVYLVPVYQSTFDAMIHWTWPYQNTDNYRMRIVAFVPVPVLVRMVLLVVVVISSLQPIGVFQKAPMVIFHGPYFP